MVHYRNQNGSTIFRRLVLLPHTRIHRSADRLGFQMVGSFEIGGNHGREGEHNVDYRTDGLMYIKGVFISLLSQNL